MPWNCWSCPCFDDEVTHYCCILNIYCDNYKNGRLSNCPLIELPIPHGRLIDADALSKKELNNANVPSNFIEIAPTIIEAEKE